MEHKADVTFTHTVWSGWVPGGHSITTSTRLSIGKGDTLTPHTLGLEVRIPEDSLSYRIVLDHMVEDRASFAFHGVVINNPGGTINLSAPRTGRFLLRAGESKMLSTPTMDSGIGVTVTLHSIA